MTQPCFAQYSCKRRISAWKLGTLLARAAIAPSARPRTIGAAARMRAARRHVDAAGRAFHQVLGRAILRGRRTGAPALDLRLERTPHRFDPLDVFPAVPDDGDNDAEDDELADAEIGHGDGVGERP